MNNGERSDRFLMDLYTTWRQLRQQGFSSNGFYNKEPELLLRLYPLCCIYNQG